MYKKKKTLTLESEDTPSGFTLILTFPLGETLNWLLETAAFWAAGFVGLSSSSAFPVTYRNNHYEQPLSNTASYFPLNKHNIQYETYRQQVSKQWRVAKWHGGQGQNLLVYSSTDLVICSHVSCSSVNIKNHHSFT